MNKKVTIFAAVLIIVGTIGTISSGVAAVPFTVNYVDNMIASSNKENTIYEEVVDVKKINITTEDLNVEVKPSNSDKLIVKQCGNAKSSKFSFDNKENEFFVKQNYREPEFTIQGFGEFVLNELEVGANRIAIYVPNNVDVQVNTKSGALIIEDKSVLLDKLSFSTNYGSITLPKDIKTLKNMNISSSGNLHLTSSEILGIENVNISTDGGVYIDSTPDDIFIEEIETYIPKNLNIVSSRYGSDISINTNVPVGQNLVIDNKAGYVNLNLPIDYYNMNFNLTASEGLVIDNKGSNQDENNQQNNDLKKFEGTFREPKIDEFQYNIDVKSTNINLNK